MKGPRLLASTPTIDLETFPTAERIHGWIEHLASFGHRKTGTPEGRRSADYIAGELRSFGIDDVRIESAPTPCATVHEQRLRIGNEEIEAFWANGTGRPDVLGRFHSDVHAEIVHLGPGWEEDFHGVDITGKIVICDIEFLPGTHESMLERHPRGEIYDPSGTLQTPRNKYDIYSPNNWPGNFFRAQLRGAVGFIGVLQNYMDCYNFNEDYTENGAEFGVERMEIPAVWVSRQDGRAIRVRIEEAAGHVTGQLSVDVEYELKDALNVSALLPGLEPEIILVHSHHDAVFAGAVQDASGVSEVLALAQYFAAQPIENRPKTMMFAATDTHFADYVGHVAFIHERHKAEQEIVLDLCIEHVGKEVELDSENRAVETGFVEPRMVYVSDESELLPVVRTAFARNGLDRSIFLPVSTSPSAHDEVYVFSPDEIISDAYYFAEDGIPVVSLVCGQMYLFHPSDTIDRVPLEQLRPVGLAFAEIAAAAALQLAAASVGTTPRIASASEVKAGSDA